MRPTPLTTLLTTLLVAPAVTAGAVTAAPTAAASAADTCFGLAPTIVAPAGAGLVSGTAGDDVIVAVGAARVAAGAGDDTLCLADVRWVSAGDGDDRVSHERAPRGHEVVLGAGSDLFEGSGARDRVLAEDFDGEDPVAGAGPDHTDVVRTHGGKDRIVSGDSSRPNHDVVDGGPGPDNLQVTGAAGGTATVSGAGGRDLLSVRVVGDSRLDVDLVAGTVEIDSSPVARVEGLEDVLADAFSGTAHVRGTSGPNDLSVTSGDARVRGGAGDDRLRVFGCGSVARGGAGADVVMSTFQGCGRDPVALHGGAGDDRLRGSSGPDLLVGNAGHDRAAGGRGQDVCRAEVERSCERG